MAYHLGTKLSELRRQKRETQQQVADAVGVSRPLVKAWEREPWENGARQVAETEQFEALATHFNVSVDYLLGRTEIKRPDASLTGAAAYSYLSEDALENCHHLGKACMTELSKIMGSHGFDMVVNQLVYFTNQANFIKEKLNELKQKFDAGDNITQDELDNLFAMYQSLRLERFETFEAFNSVFDSAMSYIEIETEVADFEGMIHKKWLSEHLEENGGKSGLVVSEGDPFIPDDEEA